jgi:hypothetical protein
MRFVALAIQMMLLTLPGFAQSTLASYVSPDTLTAIRAGQRLTATIPNDGHLSLLPKISSDDEIAEKVASIHPTVGVEVVGLIGGPDMSGSDGALSLYNMLHAVSSMEGMMYYSVTHGAREVLFRQSFVITSLSKPTKVPDPVFTSIPADDSIMTLQEDTSFGRILYEERYAYRKDHVVATIENLTNVNFLFVPIIQPRNLVSIFVVVPVGKELLYYGICYLRTGMPLGDRTLREASLRNRLYAMADWMKARLDEWPTRK